MYFLVSSEDISGSRQGMQCLDLAASRSSMMGMVTVKGILGGKRPQQRQKRQYLVCQACQGSVLLPPPLSKLQYPLDASWGLHHLSQLGAFWKHLEKSNIRSQKGQRLVDACLQPAPHLYQMKQIWGEWGIYFLKKRSIASRQKLGLPLPFPGLPPSSSPSGGSILCGEAIWKINAI